MTRLYLSVTLLLTGCAQTSRSASQSSGDEIRGLYESGYESRHFVLCGDPDGVRRPVEFAPGARPKHWPDGVPGGYNSTVYFVRWRGTIAARKRTAMGIRTDLPPIVVNEVLEVRAPRRGECGWRPDRP